MAIQGKTAAQAAETRSQVKSQGFQTVVARTLLKAKRTLWGVGIFSVFINILMLTGPLYMLQVYDRVLLSGSVETLIGITILMAAMFAFMGVLDWVRGRVLARLAEGFGQELGPDTFSRWLASGTRKASATQPVQDLSTLQQFLSSNAPSTFFDMPWIVIFIGVIFLLHPMLGVLAVFGAVVLAIGAIYNERSTREPTIEALGLQREERSLSLQAARNADTLTALGMGPAVKARWMELNGRTRGKTLDAADKRSSATAFTKGFRMFIQSSILGLGGYYAIQGIITPGAMIAGSIIMGRAMAPLQQAIGQWRSVLSARDAHNRLTEFLDTTPELGEQTELPPPQGRLTVEAMSAAAPGDRKAILRGINFTLEPGAGLAIIGPSASGKTTLARLLTGVWTPQSGSVRLDGATFAQYSPDAIRAALGYLPQDVELFDGSIKDNIARFDADASDSDVQAAAMLAGVHDLILHLPEDYQTRVGTGGAVLSGGQIQRIALARAVYGMPKLVVLDEPNASLDEAGDMALSTCIKALRDAGSTVVVIAHRRSAIVQLDQLLVLKEGRQAAFGPKADVLQAMREERGQGGDNVQPIPSPVKASTSKAPSMVPKRQVSRSSGFSGPTGSTGLSTPRKS